MGQQAKAKAQVRHMKKLFGGKETAFEVHQKYGFRMACCAPGTNKNNRCGGPPVIRIRVYTPYLELFSKHPEFCIQIAAGNRDGSYVPTVDTKWGPMVLLSDMTACKFHQQSAERAAAHPPKGLQTWVTIDRGPTAEKVVGQVPLVGVSS